MSLLSAKRFEIPLILIDAYIPLNMYIDNITLYLAVTFLVWTKPGR